MALIVGVVFSQIAFAQSRYPRPVQVNGAWGYIDDSGKVVIEPQFEKAKEFSEGVAEVASGSKTLFIDQLGKTVFVLPQSTRVFGTFSDGLISFENESEDSRGCGFLDKSGKAVIAVDGGFCSSAFPFNFPSFSQGLTNAGNSFIDKQGKVVSLVKAYKVWPITEWDAF